MTESVNDNLQISGRFRLEGVDVLRGLSVLLVLLHHIHLRFWINNYDVNDVLPKPLNQVLFWSGYYAVITFFVISGFLITSLSVRRWQTAANVHVGISCGRCLSRRSSTWSSLCCAFWFVASDYWCRPCLA